MHYWGKCEGRLFLPHLIDNRAHIPPYIELPPPVQAFVAAHRGETAPITVRATRRRLQIDMYVYMSSNHIQTHIRVSIHPSIHPPIHPPIHVPSSIQVGRHTAVIEYAHMTVEEVGALSPSLSLPLSLSLSLSL